MQYVGSKNRLSKELAPIIQSYITDETVAYIEPFVGGANMIDKIKHHNKIGSDLHKELIALHNYNKKHVTHIPDTFTKEEWNNVKNNKTSYPDWYVGLTGFCSFGSIYFSAYPQSKKCSDVPAQMIRSIKRQSPNIQDITFECKSFSDYNPLDYKNCVFYLDPPYRKTLSYSTGGFPYEEFDKWAIELAKNNTVLISEYEMPEDKFECIWSKEVKVTLNANGSMANNKRVEKLFKVRGGI
ncbi:hypothetical protein EF36P1_00017 [Enterococcus phage EF36P1]|jgi:site-specific DNA-adenine methylase|nr:hypothetical protein EF36P1_00017 [Enterococcus phage EF36P1]WAX14922.1 hypothetical protein EF36P2_00045 [Enterococcus phage EF36P2]WAX14994.1 hypothetical protein EF36P3_00055 [Enterococcus phage EF36P3]DAT36865.1 MAG TPA: DNA adenine methylase [Caudoviricetes sp.]